MASRSKRFPISLPPRHMKLLIYWAHLKRTSKTAQTEKTMEARLEANEDQILRWMADEAADLGIPVQEHEAAVLKAGGFDPSDYWDDGDSPE